MGHCRRPPATAERIRPSQRRAAGSTLLPREDDGHRDSYIGVNGLTVDVGGTRINGAFVHCAKQPTLCSTADSTVAVTSSASVERAPLASNGAS